MSACEQQTSGTIELYFYDELEPSAREAFERHRQSCVECRRAIEDLSVIRAALATRPVVAAPADGNWDRFMARLDDAVRFEQARHTVVPFPSGSDRQPADRRQRPAARYLAIAAAMTIATTSLVYYVARPVQTPDPAAPGAMSAATDPDAPIDVSAPMVPAVQSADAAFAAVSEQHFERSKLVVLGLANKDPKQANEADWAYERGLASNLLSDTRLYRLAAEERGMKTLADVMGDLELVFLETSLTDKPDTETLEQIQRLIHKRDLVTKMEVATTGS